MRCMAAYFLSSQYFQIFLSQIFCIKSKFAKSFVSSQYLPDLFYQYFPSASYGIAQGFQIAAAAQAAQEEEIVQSTVSQSLKHCRSDTWIKKVKTEILAL